jgi:hypothetical protein
MNELTLFDDILAIITVIVMLGLMFGLVLIFIMHILMPKKVLETYFKEPYFRPAEITMFTGFPFGYMRTAMFMRALAFPASGKRRGVENAYKQLLANRCERLSDYLLGEVYRVKCSSEGFSCAHWVMDCRDAFYFLYD